MACTTCGGGRTAQKYNVKTAAAAAVKFEVQCISCVGAMQGKWGVTWPTLPNNWLLLDEENIVFMIEQYVAEFEFRTEERADLFRLRNGY